MTFAGVSFMTKEKKYLFKLKNSQLFFDETFC